MDAKVLLICLDHAIRGGRSASGCVKTDRDTRVASVNPDANQVRLGALGARGRLNRIVSTIERELAYGDYDVKLKASAKALLDARFAKGTAYNDVAMREIQAVGA